ncbi:unnamed protein product [Rhizophagus irregularis]|uniref:Uncharacterized protein n=1 Tax=Rhizophagus irregularis TaxID=588596 RepID=A0A916E1P1_9GLOM|nr:hypothetical protein RIR_jg26970.t1 [Rhizophagus irregularis DAOM 181602=DAOM 197198]CAB4494195.1 unnamed protein product [Rhizophagus irregularis]CAB5351059.1 unnamed protein product [Rhizophagus irregularis]
MNCGESSSGKGKRPVINENEELIVSSGEENTTPNIKFKRSRGKPQKMEVHLANECIQCPEEISRYWHENVAN